MPNKISSRRNAIRGLSGIAFGGLSAGLFSSCETIEGAATVSRRSTNRTSTTQRSLQDVLDSVTTRKARSTEAQGVREGTQRVGFRRLASSESAVAPRRIEPPTRAKASTSTKEETPSFWSRFGRSETRGSTRLVQSRGSRIASLARSWVGRSFRYGQHAQCAAFVSSIVSSENIAFRAAARAFDSDAIGPRVSRSNLQPGDIVMFQRTYSSPHRITHVGVYVGQGQFVHRSTKSGPVKLSSINSSHYSPRYYTARRIS